jgi:hypothetical protein
MLLMVSQHFTIRVWGSVGPLGQREPMADIELGPTEPGDTLTINRHRGYEILYQKMLAPAPEQPTLWHRGEGDD